MKTLVLRPSVLQQGDRRQVRVTEVPVGAFKIKGAFNFTARSIGIKVQFNRECFVFRIIVFIRIQNLNVEVIYFLLNVSNMCVSFK